MTTCGDDESPTLQNDERDIEVGVWPAHPDMRADGGPKAIVVQIDTGKLTGRLRVNVNDAPIYDGDPETDEVPGARFLIDWPEVHVSEEVASTVLDFFEGGRDPGHFAGLLIRTILAADTENAEAIGLGFREWVRAVGLWRSNKDELRSAAGR